jgi:hypothetical protein
MYLYIFSQLNAAVFVIDKALEHQAHVQCRGVHVTICPGPKTRANSPVSAPPRIPAYRLFFSGYATAILVHGVFIMLFFFIAIDIQL